MNHQVINRRQKAAKSRRYESRRSFIFNCLLPAACCLLLLISAGCRNGAEKGSAGDPATLRNVPASRLAYSFAPDVEAPPGAAVEKENPLKAVESDFDTRRKDDRLLRTVVSPDGLRALALYDTGETQEGEFRIDMYSAEGQFLRNLTPPELSGAFAPMVAWSPDGQSIAFIGRKSLTPQTPPDMIPEAARPAEPLPTPSIAPAFAPVPVFDTEQIYTCNRDGFELKPVTTRNGLIYFYLAWSPDAHALSALACREDEWEVRERESKRPAGRPRIIEVSGRELLLDDGLTDAGPVWSPDSSKVAAAFETEVKIYDALAETQTRASILLRDPLLKASAEYDEKNLQSKNKTGDKEGGKGAGGGGGAAAQTTSQATDAAPVSFNPIVRLYWPEEKSLFIQTAYVRIYSSEPVITFQRWHKLNLSLQATVLSRLGHSIYGRTRFASRVL
jgi:hypothetical protein